MAEDGFGFFDLLAGDVDKFHLRVEPAASAGVAASAANYGAAKMKYYSVTMVVMGSRGMS